MYGEAGLCYDKAGCHMFVMVNFDKNSAVICGVMEE